MTSQFVTPATRSLRTIILAHKQKVKANTQTKPKFAENLQNITCPLPHTHTHTHTHTTISAKTQQC